MDDGLGSKGVRKRRSATQPIHDFFYIATPKIFEWLGWVVLLGGVQFLYNKSHSIWIAILLGILYVSIVGYYVGFFYKHRIEMPWLRSERHQYLVPYFLGLLIAVTVIFFVDAALPIFAAGLQG